MFNELEKKFDIQTIEPDAPLVGEVHDLPVSETEELDNDMDKARKSIQNALDVADDAVKQLAMIAASSESARAYEVLGTLITSISNSAEKLIQLQKHKADTIKRSGKGGQLPPGTGVAAFVGTTKDLQQWVKNIQKSESEE